jgi:hypothetical protein
MACGPAGSMEQEDLSQSFLINIYRLGMSPVVVSAFEALLNQLRGAGTKATGLVDANRGLLGKAARYGPGSVRTLEEFGKGNYLESAGSVGGMLAAGAGVKALAAGHSLLVSLACLLRVVCTQQVV